MSDQDKIFDLIDMDDIKNFSFKDYPVLPLRNALVLPETVVPLLIGRKATVGAIEDAMLHDKKVFCVTQKTNIESDDDPKAKNMYRVGTICNILQMFKLPDGNIRILIHGESRAIVKRFTHNQNFMSAFVKKENKIFTAESVYLKAKIRSLRKGMHGYIKLHGSIPEESLLAMQEINYPEDLFYFALANVDLEIKIKQKLFELEDLEMSIDKLYELLHKELQILTLENNIESKVKTKLNKIQKEYYLTEQLKIIHKELGITSDENVDILEFQEKIESTNLSDEARKKAEEELKRLSRLSPHSQEYGVIHHYLSWILDLPWAQPDHKKFELGSAEKILDNDHYGLKKVKNRILEYLAVMQLTSKVRGQILCFVGPPGVGKTSLGKSIAKALGREFVRLSLGGVRDEAEIRGHRRTYIGAMPGVIIQSLKKAGTKNPLIMMDEVDKMSMDFRGDPSSALLEVLDSEQNTHFRDHYLDFGFDLSDVLFITTANYRDYIPQPLLDRMEIINISGYTEIEKFNIAQKHLIPRTFDDHEIKDKFKINIKEDTLRDIIRFYTRESGVRELERKIAAITRKSIKRFLEKKIKKSITISPKNLSDFLGIKKHLYSEVNRKDRVGVVTGLAWTASGGETLQIEVIKLKGDGKLKLTGQLGEVMQESAQAAYTYARKYAKKYGYDPDFYKEIDIHLHIPEGAIPKDGPSAGVTITTALVSVLSNKKIDHNLAMTGEITLTGNVLPIGGLTEKLIAAKRAGIQKVLIPKLNHPNLTEVPSEVKENLNITEVKTLKEVLEIALIN